MFEKSLTSQEHRLHIFNNSQSVSSSTMLCSWSRHNIKQTGSQNLYSLGTTRINKYENRISEDWGQHYVKQIEDNLGKSEDGERVSWRFQLIFATVAQPQLIRRQKRAIRALRGPLWQYTHNDIAALGPFSVTEFNLVSSHDVYYVCALNMIFSIWSDLSSPQLTLIFLSGSGLVRARPAGAKAPVIPWGHLLPPNGCRQISAMETPGMVQFTTLMKRKEREREKYLGSVKGHFKCVHTLNAVNTQDSLAVRFPG